MNRRCWAAWIGAFLAIVLAVVAFFRNADGIDGLMVIIALACVLLAIQSHQAVFRR
ncbi:hypothetical protein P0W64_10025 [Tsukamurella sp. 8F]|uniref:hypothetical protein n=1 Tax=unclassified Tsukamurella TaxID=2633480 RepID=UPI0023B91534|nr:MULTISPECIES: hypothetical protein [unclassified Tsukamurella]MDF0529385.1 hypothetical protein [Tsukamurella sp. 8J]MDF0587108.1 hypothetical protein [Tsukamurella sp. 8F]